ncbi:MAG: UDP-N-acetylmuramate dehydrogenase [Rhizomicrobium sp.]
MSFTPLAKLPVVRGSYTENAPLSHLVWFRVGGPAQVLFRPADTDDLADFLKNKPADVPVLVLGVGSNMLIRDGGIPGVVIRLPSAFGQVRAEGTKIIAGATALDAAVARVAADAGVAGFEFMRGIPGTIGGALTMNAGCHGRELKDVFVSATAVDAEGNIHHYNAGDMNFVYRKSNLAAGTIFTEAVLEGTPDAPVAIHARMDELMAKREAAQPVKSRTGGSTFKNPPAQSAWKLIDEAGCRGLTRGGAMVSDMHCNFLINTGSATAADIEGLGEDVRARVLATSGIELEWEIKRVGQP